MKKQSKSWGKCLWCKKPVLKSEGASMTCGKVWHSGLCDHKWREKQKADKIKTTGFLDIRLDEIRSVKDPSVAGIRDYLVEDVGRPCKHYDPECFSCRQWSAWLTMYNLIEKDKV